MRKEKYFAISPRIARWKLDNSLENWLSYKADFSEFWRKIYILYYKYLIVNTIVLESKWQKMPLKPMA